MKLKNALGILLVSLFTFTACSSQPQPFVAGQDDCYVCKMGIADFKYGGEIMTKKGKIYKFDDLRCMISFIRSGTLEEKDISKTLTIQYNKPNEFLDVHKAVFLVNPDLRSPMGSNAAGFASKEDAEKLKGQSGQLFNWAALISGSK